MPRVLEIVDARGHQAREDIRVRQRGDLLQLPALEEPVHGLGNIRSVGRVVVRVRGDVPGKWRVGGGGGVQ